MPNLVLLFLFPCFFLGAFWWGAAWFLFRVSKAFGDNAIAIDHHGALQEFVLKRFLNP